MWWLIVVLEIFSLAAVVHLWTRGGSAWRKLRWTFVALLPLLGPLLCLGLYRVPGPDLINHANPEPHPERVISTDFGIEG